jgi:hypothetical protein
VRHELPVGGCAGPGVGPGVEIGALQRPQHRERDREVGAVEASEQPAVRQRRRQRRGLEIEIALRRLPLEPRKIVDEGGGTSNQHRLSGSRRPAEESCLEAQQVGDEPVVLREPCIERGFGHGTVAYRAQKRVTRGPGPGVRVALR